MNTNTYLYNTPDGDNIKIEYANSKFVFSMLKSEITQITEADINAVIKAFAQIQCRYILLIYKIVNDDNTRILLFNPYIYDNNGKRIYYKELTIDIAIKN